MPCKQYVKKRVWDISTVDRPLFVTLQVVGEEVFGEIVADALAERIFNEFQVRGQMFFVERDRQKLLETIGHVVGERPVAVQERNDAVVVRRIGFVTGFVESDVSGVGVDKSGFVQRIAAHRAADGVRQEFFDRVGQQPGFEFRFRNIVAVTVFRIAGERDLLERHVRRQFVRETVGVDENTVVLLFEPLHFQCRIVPVLT